MNATNSSIDNSMEFPDVMHVVLAFPLDRAEHMLLDRPHAILPTLNTRRI